MKKQNIYLTLALLILSIASVSAVGMQQNQQKIHDSEPVLGTYELSTEDIYGLLLMREEEKLARDVYLELYDKWELNIFQNIAKSEQTHTDAVKVLLDAYEIEDPVINDERGVFRNQDLQELYSQLVEKGSESLENAIIVGLTIEDLDIKDLNKLLDETQNKDIKMVYENLVKGSRNHLRSFYKQAQKNNVEYSAQYISQEEFDSIISTDNERGSFMNENNEIETNFQNQLRINQNKGFKLSNGRNAQIKIMPETASQKAIERLRLKNCDEDCSIELKEVDVGQNQKAAYEVKAKKESKIFGLFKKIMDVETQIDAESGEIISTKKPWWSFLASESN